MSRLLGLENGLMDDRLTRTDSMARVRTPQTATSAEIISVHSSQILRASSLLSRLFAVLAVGLEGRTATVGDDPNRFQVLVKLLFIDI